MLQLRHKNCGGNININVEITNVFGKPNIKIKEDYKILISFESLLARNVIIKTTGLRCDKCEKVLKDNKELEIQCAFSGNNGAVEDFRIIYAIKKGTGERLNPQLLHTKVIKDYIADIERDGFVAKEVEPKIFLDEKVRNG